MAAELKQISSSGAFKTKGGYVYSVTLTPGSAAATLSLRNGGASDTVVLTVTAVANGASASVEFPNGVYLPQGIYGTLSGTGATAAVAFR